MDIRKMTSEELEKLSHLDIAYNIIKNEKKVLNTLDLLKEVCNVLNYGESAVEELIGEFYTSLNLDKRFILIDGKWDIAENHSVKIVVDDEMDDELDTFEDMDEEDEEAKEIEDEAVLEDVEVLEDLDDDIDDEMDDLTILSEEEIEEDEENM